MLRILQHIVFLISADLSWVPRLAIDRNGLSHGDRLAGRELESRAFLETGRGKRVGFRSREDDILGRVLRYSGYGIFEGSESKDPILGKAREMLQMAMKGALELRSQSDALRPHLSTFTLVTRAQQFLSFQGGRACLRNFTYGLELEASHCLVHITAAGRPEVVMTPPTQPCKVSTPRLQWSTN